MLLIYMTRFSKYRRTQIFLTIFLAAMFLVGMAALTNPKGNYEWFPFYSWSMFGLVPQDETIYRLTIIVPEESEERIDFRSAGDRVHHPHSLQAYHLIQKMGRAMDQNDMHELDSLRAAFEASFLKPDTFYQISKSREDPLTAWQQSGTSSDDEIIGRFRAGREVR